MNAYLSSGQLDKHSDDVGFARRRLLWDLGGELHLHALDLLLPLRLLPLEPELLLFLALLLLLLLFLLAFLLL